MSLLKDLVSYWSFDSGTYDTGTKVVNDLHGSNNGTANDARVYGTDGKLNKGADFTKGNDSILVNDSSSLDTGTEFSFSFWFKSNTIATEYQSILMYGRTNSSGKNNAILLNYGNIIFIVRDQGTKGNFNNITNAQWYFVTVTYKSGTNNTKLYINGNFATQNTATINYDSNSEIYFGVYRQPDSPFGFFYYYNGFVDETGIWSRELSAAEVKVLYNNGKGLAYPFSGRSIFFGGGL